MIIETINITEAPANVPSKKGSTQEIIDALQSVEVGSILKIQPEKSMRGTKTAFGRIAKSVGLTITQWDDNTFLYVRVDTPITEVETEAAA